MPLELIARHPAGKAHRVPLLFIHGAWHAAWYWDIHFLPWFAEKGFHSYALSLRGHGGSPGRDALRWTGARHYVQDVIKAAEIIAAETDKTPILIGHSMGGYVVQKLMERVVPPGVVLLASVPAHGTMGFMLRLARHQPVSVLKAMLSLSPYHVVSTPELVRRHFYSDKLPQEKVRAYHARLQEESFRIVWESALFNRPRPGRTAKAPMLVIAAHDDAVFSVRDQRETAARYEAPLHVLPDAPHNPMLEPNWEQCAEVIHDWLKKVYL